MRGNGFRIVASISRRIVIDSLLSRGDESGRMAGMKQTEFMCAISAVLFVCLVVLGVVTGTRSVWVCSLCSFVLMLLFAHRWYQAEKFRDELTTMKDSQHNPDAQNTVEERRPRRGNMMMTIMPVLVLVALVGCASNRDRREHDGVSLNDDPWSKPPSVAGPSLSPDEVLLKTEVTQIDLSDSNPCIEDLTEVGVYRSLSSRPDSDGLWEVFYAVHVIERQRILGAETKVIMAKQEDCRITKDSLFAILLATVKIDTREHSEIRTWNSWSGWFLISNVERGEPNFHDYHLARSTSITDVWDRISASRLATQPPAH
jgi:hypothetical protein